jgi:hypothetical protein
MALGAYRVHHFLAAALGTLGGCRLRCDRRRGKHGCGYQLPRQSGEWRTIFSGRRVVHGRLPVGSLEHFNTTPRARGARSYANTVATGRKKVVDLYQLTLEILCLPIRGLPGRFPSRRFSQGEKKLAAASSSS